MRRARRTGQNHSSSYCRPRPVWQGTERRGCCQQERELKPHYRSTIVSPAFIFFSSKCFPPVYAYRLRFSNAGISCTRCINSTRVIGVALLRNRAGDSEKSSPRGLGAGLVPAAPPRGFVRNKTTSRNRHQARAPCDRADAETTATVKKRRATASPPCPSTNKYKVTANYTTPNGPSAECVTPPVPITALASLHPTF